MSLSTETIAYIRKVADRHEARGQICDAAYFRAYAAHWERKRDNLKCPATCRECEKLAGEG